MPTRMIKNNQTNSTWRSFNCNMLAESASIFTNESTAWVKIFNEIIVWAEDRKIYLWLLDVPGRAIPNVSSHKLGPLDQCPCVLQPTDQQSHQLLELRYNDFLLPVSPAEICRDFWRACWPLCSTHWSCSPTLRISVYPQPTHNHFPQPSQCLDSEFDPNPFPLRFTKPLEPTPTGMVSKSSCCINSSVSLEKCFSP